MKKILAIFAAIPAGWCVAAVFVLTGTESALLVGFLVPGEIAAILGGVVASRGRVPLPAVLAAAIFGAWCGDSCGYFLGRKAGPAFFGKRRQKQRAKARELLKRGGIAVFVGRFTPFLRTFIPAAAGAVKMPYRRFLPWNLAGGLAWGATSVLLGYWGGRDARVLIHRAGVVGLGLLVVVMAALTIFWKRRKMH